MPNKRKSSPENTPKLKRFTASVWFFPVILLLPILLLTAFKISGSSIGVYHDYLYGNTKDSSLIAGSPRLVRSDEWRVNSQMTIAQSNNHYARINHNIGGGQDMSVLPDEPYREWSEAFKPHNWAFFILPFEQAFAFKWWIMGYLVVVSCYFFVLAMLPGRKLLAALMGLALLFSAFLQWWYVISSLGSIYYSLFLLTAFIHLMRSKTRKQSIALGLVIAYLLVSFALLLYPPFQIACTLVAVTFGVGFLAQQYPLMPRKIWLERIGIIATAGIVAGLAVLLFIHTRSDVIQTIQNTAYPGKRVVQSGGFNLPHIFAGNLGFQFRSDARTASYLPVWFNNQSETSNFLLLLPFLLLPSALILYRDFRKRKPTDWPLLFTGLLFFVFLAWILIPHVPLIGKLLLLNKVPDTRLLIGIGLLSLVQSVLFIRRAPDFKGKLFERRFVLVYAALVFIFELLVGLHAKRAFPVFISFERAFIFAIPFPVIVYLVLRKRFEWAVAGLLAFSLFTSIWINPLYRGTAVITQTPLSKAIRSLSAHDSGRWVAEDTRFENFALLNGAHSLSGVYGYPQLGIWSSTGSDKKIYNRYAHTSFGFDRHIDTSIPTRLELEAPDYFQVITEPCGAFLQKEHVRFIIAGNKLNPDEGCVKLVDTIQYPTLNVYIYRINH